MDLLMGSLKIIMIIVAAPIAAVGAIIGVIAVLLFTFTVLLVAGWIQEIMQRIKADDFGGRE